MSAAIVTRPALTGHAIAEGLRALAVIFDHGDMPTRVHPDQAVRVSVALASAAAVHEFAARCGVLADVGPDDARTHIHTSFEVPLGMGTQLDSEAAAYAGSVALAVYNIHLAVSE